MPMPIPAAVTTRLTALKNVGDSATGFVTKLLASLDDTLGASNMFGSAAAKNAGSAAGNVPLLDGNGKIPTGLLPNAVVQFTDQTGAFQWKAGTSRGRNPIVYTTPFPTDSLCVVISPRIGSGGGNPQVEPNLFVSQESRTQFTVRRFINVNNYSSVLGYHFDYIAIGY